MRWGCPHQQVSLLIRWQCACTRGISTKLSRAMAPELA